MKLEVGDKIHITNWFGAPVDHTATITRITGGDIFFTPGVAVPHLKNAPVRIRHNYLDECTIEKVGHEYTHRCDETCEERLERQARTIATERRRNEALTKENAVLRAEVVNVNAKLVSLRAQYSAPRNRSDANWDSKPRPEVSE